MAVLAVAEKPDGDAGAWVLYLHTDQSAELWYRPKAGSGGHSLTGRRVLYEVRAEMAALGVGEDGWAPV